MTEGRGGGLRLGPAKYALDAEPPIVPDATGSYADFIAARLGRGVEVEPLTLRSLREDADLRAHAGLPEPFVDF